MKLRVECAPAFDYARAEHTMEFQPDNSSPPVPSGTSTPLVSTAKSADPYYNVAQTLLGPDQPERSLKKCIFKSKDLSLDLRIVPASTMDSVDSPKVVFEELDLASVGHKGPSVCCNLDLQEGQVVTFVLRIPPKADALGKKKIKKPSQQTADELGIPLESWTT